MVPISQRYAGRVMTILCLWTVVAHQSLQQEGSLTELGLDRPVFILGFYLSLWENTSLVYKMQILLTILYKV